MEFPGATVKSEVKTESDLEEEVPHIPMLDQARDDVLLRSVKEESDIAQAVPHIPILDQAQDDVLVKSVKEDGEMAGQQPNTSTMADQPHDDSWVKSEFQIEIDVAEEMPDQQLADQTQDEPDETRETCIPEQLLDDICDSDSDEEFLGFTQEEDVKDFGAEEESADTEEGVLGDDSDSDIDDCAVSGGYDHSWLQEFNAVSGPVDVPDDISEGSLFRLFITDEVFHLFVTETNRYAAQKAERIGSNSAAHSYVSLWKEVKFDEMKAFLAILLLMGMSQRSSYDLYWSTDKYLEMPGFRSIMSRNRFLRILSFFHLTDNSTSKPSDHPEHDRAHKVRPLLELLIPLWQRYYAPAKEISIDESMIPFKGRTNFLQYMPSKPTKWGLKAWGLADSKTGYMWNWRLYLGKDEVERLFQNVGLAHRVVTNLAQPLYKKGHVLYMDNFFTSGALFEELAENQTGACGTVSLNRRGVPPRIKAASSRPAVGAEPVTQRVGHSLYIAWRDKRPLNMITSVHSKQTFGKEVQSKLGVNHMQVLQKPCAIEAYTKHMGGVDRADKALSFYMVHHKSRKWWIKVFFYLLEVCFTNALVIWRQKHQGRVCAQKFRLQIVHDLLQGVQCTAVYKRGRLPNNAPDRVVNYEHTLVINDKRLASGRPSRLDCIVCSDRSFKRHQTPFICRKCRVALCPFPCFSRYHSLVHFKARCTPELHEK